LSAPVFWPKSCTAGGIASVSGEMASSIKILIVDANPVRAAIIQEGLREAGAHEIVLLGGTNGLVAAIEAHDPDVVVIDLENPSRDALADMFLVSRHVKRPITMFVDQSDEASIEEAVEAGVSAYIVDGLKKERLKPILQTCISRFNAFRRLQQELDEARSQLDDRKAIDRAKGIVMRLKGLSEEEAYALLRRTAMNEKRKLVDIARSIITAAEVLK
jgi:response regulator NasT